MPKCGLLLWMFFQCCFSSTHPYKCLTVVPDRPAWCCTYLKKDHSAVRVIYFVNLQMYTRYKTSHHVEEEILLLDRRSVDVEVGVRDGVSLVVDRKSTRLNSSHVA